MCGLVPLSVLNADLLIANESDMDLLIRQMLNIGEAMYYAGAEISRIEETLYRLGKAYGAEHMNVYAITSSILITMEFRGMEAVTQSRRIRRDAMDLSKLNHLYRLCCDCIDSPIPVEALKEKILVILDERLDDLTNALGKVIAASVLTIFFGGGLADALCSGFEACFIVLRLRNV